MLLLPLDSDLKLTAATKSPLPTVPITYLRRRYFLIDVLQRSHEHTSVCVCALTEPGTFGSNASFTPWC